MNYCMRRKYVAVVVFVSWPARRLLHKPNFFFLTIGRAIIGMEHVTTWALLVAENGVLKRASSGYLRQAGMAIMPQGFFSNIVYYNVVFLSSCLELAFSVCFASA